MPRLPQSTLRAALPLALGIGLSLGLVARPAPAQESGDLLDASLTPQPGAVAAYLQARALVQIGRQVQDPLLVLTAARLLHGLGLVDWPRQSQPPATPRPVTAPDAQALLDLARMIDAGGTHADLIDQIAREVSPAPRALRATAASLAPGQSQVWTIGIFGGASSELAVLAEVGLLEVVVTAGVGDGEVICADRGGDAQAYCAFVLGENGDVAVSVTNRGSAEARYLLLTE